MANVLEKIGEFHDVEVFIKKSMPWPRIESLSDLLDYTANERDRNVKPRMLVLTQKEALALKLDVLYQDRQRALADSKETP